MVTEQEARDMKTAITEFEKADALVKKTLFNDNKVIAEKWFDNLRIDIQGANTRRHALANFTQIESLLKTETDRFRLFVLREKLYEANKKYRTIKELNPNS